MDDVVIGKRLREIRLGRDLQQRHAAQKLGISPAYLNLIEKGKRAVKLPLLWKALALYEHELESFMGSLGEKRPDDALAKLLDDPLARTLDLDESDLARLAAEPKTATTIAALFNLYKNTRAQLDTTVAKLSAEQDLRAAGPRAGTPSARSFYEPLDEVSDFLQAHQNFFPELEAAAERIRQDFSLGRRVLSRELERVLTQRFGFEVQRVVPGEGSSVVRTIDRARHVITVSEGLAEHALKFQLAAALGLLALDEDHMHEPLTESFSARHAETRRLIKIHLANYFAGALLLPYDDYFQHVQRTHYDVDALAALFEMSYEACAHRLCNLSDPKKPGIPLHFLRVDIAGNISKRYSATGLTFPQGTGSCPKWAAHVAFMTPSVVTRQFSAMPDGRTYFCFAKITSQPERGSLVRGTNYSIAIGTTADLARHLVYSKDLHAQELARTAIPVGTTCRYCERTDCNQRAAPSYKFAFAVDEYIKKDNFFSPLTRG